MHLLDKKTMPYYEILLPNTKKGTADMLLSAGRGTQKPESYKQSNGQFFMPHQGPEGQIKTTFFLQHNRQEDSLQVPMGASIIGVDTKGCFSKAF